MCGYVLKAPREVSKCSQGREHALSGAQATWVDGRNCGALCTASCLPLKDRGTVHAEPTAVVGGFQIPQSLSNKVNLFTGEMPDFWALHKRTLHTALWEPQELLSPDRKQLQSQLAML